MLSSVPTRNRAGTSAARLLAVAVFASALAVVPVGSHGSVAVAATSTGFTDVPPTAKVGEPYTFAGTVTDEGAIDAVEVSTDGGVAWRAASWRAGQVNWSHTFTPATSGTAQLRVRALDSADAVIDEAAAQTSVEARVCPCGLWSDSDVPAATSTDYAPVELGVKWRATSDGYVRGIRFHKARTNTGTHTGSLWTSAGALLATGTFRDETASGWQTLVLPEPVRVTRDTTYVASYLAPRGQYSYDRDYFRESRYLEPLTGLGTGVDGANGVFRQGGGFPDTASPSDANYWVDLVWAPEPGADTRVPYVLGTTPVDGAGSVGTRPQLTATFDEPVVPNSVEFTLFGAAGTVTGQTSVQSGGRTVQFTPWNALTYTTPYIATVRARDAAGNQSGTYIWRFITGAERRTECPCTLWDDYFSPAVPTVEDAQPVELGVKVRFAGRGEVLGVRFFKGVGGGSWHTGSFWTSTGTLLATGTFANETTTGWQTLMFAQPVPVEAGTTYVASYFAPSGRYGVTQRYFEVQHPMTFGSISVPPDSPSSPNGLYRYGGGFPTSGHAASNYWVAPVYRTSLNGDSTRPTLDSRTPAAGTTDVALDQPLTLGFSEPVDPLSAVITLLDSSGGFLHGTSTASADRRTLTWTANGALKPGTRYQARVQVADVNGNTMAAMDTWSFTTVPTTDCPCSLFSAAAVPTSRSLTDSGAYELGIRFSSTRDGWVDGVRFHKSDGSTGTHTGSLWTSSGVRIATGTFTGETDTGWQTLRFAEPVAIVSGETYVASYTVSDGRYSFNEQYFLWGRTVVSPPLASEGGEASGVYVPGSGFPRISGNGANYWVDVDFRPDDAGLSSVRMGLTPWASA
ncbi:DUF4082 domain-containing protein [Actinosynnema sp. NPDC004786]